MRELYGQMRALAARSLEAERPGHTLQATALVHEVLLKLMGPREVPWQSRAHFYHAAAEAMRQVLIDHARTKRRVKRGGGQAERVELGEVAGLASAGEDDREVDHVALDRAFRRLASQEPRLAEVVRLRFYVGLGVGEAAQVLGVSERTVKSDWAFAKAWLQRELGYTDDDNHTDRESRDHE